MLFVHRLSRPLPSVQTPNVYTETVTQPTPKEESNIQNDASPKTGTIKKEEKKGPIRRFLKYFLSKPKSKWETLKRLTTSAIIGYAVIKTPALWIATNELSRNSLMPQASASATTPDHPTGQIDIDNFVENYSGFEKIKKAVAEAFIDDAKVLDLNKNGTILENEAEILNLIGLLQEKLNNPSENTNKQTLIDGINLLHEINMVNNALWGKDGLKPETIHQEGGNCQITAGVISSALTHENTQNLKSLIQVTGFRPHKLFPEIDSIVNINGKQIPVPYLEINKWRGIRQQGSVEAPYILSYAIEKELKEHYIANPSGFTSPSSSTLLTGKDYSMIFLPALSDRALIKILEQAPNIPINIGSYPESADYFGRIAGYFTGKGPRDEDETYTPKVRPYHEFAVKEIKKEDGQYFVTIVSTNPNMNNISEVTLTLDELRDTMVSVTAPKDSFSLLDSDSLKLYLLSLILIVLSRKGFNYLDKRKINKKGIAAT